MFVALAVIVGGSGFGGGFGAKPTLMLARAAPPVRTSSDGITSRVNVSPCSAPTAARSRVGPSNPSSGAPLRSQAYLNAVAPVYDAAHVSLLPTVATPDTAGPEVRTGAVAGSNVSGAVTL